LRAGWHFHDNWQGRLQAAYARLEGGDRHFADPEFSRQRGFAFRSHLAEVSLQLVWEPWGRRRFPRAGGYRSIVSPYAFAGWGTAWLSVEPDFGPHAHDGLQARIAADQQAMPAAPQWTLPFGAGVHLDLNPQASLGLELALTKTFTDYLDGISQSANPEAADWYAYGGLTLTYRWVRPDYDRDQVLDEVDHCPREAGLGKNQGCPDADKDGVIDRFDLCPYQPGTAVLQGCPDDDYDGVANLLDKCPDRPGTVGAQGCPDADGDGLADEADLCPDCPGKLAADGCPDADEDGLPDGKDRCPTAPGPWEWLGCPFPDSDLDGTADEKDDCPDQRGPRNLRGCPDTDGDGLADHEDRCPTVPGVPADGGCPPVPEEIEQTLQLVTRNVQFETGSARLLPGSLEKLQTLVDILMEYPYFYLRIEGHTDSQGAAVSNLRLSEERALACYTYLLEKGIAAERMHYAGFGEEQPLADNRTIAGRRMNRRVVFALYVP
jgi:outer membrane protein OmpA-like peptidoglycan-associated protein